MRAVKTVLPLLLLAFLTPLFGAETNKYAQKIGLVSDASSALRYYDGLFLKSALNAGAGRKDIVILPGAPEELEALGVKELNARALIRTSRSADGGNFTVGIYTDAGGAGGDLAGGALAFRDGGFVDALGSIPGKIIEILAGFYPMKDKKEVETIVVVKKGISEFEKENPTFTFSIIPACYQSGQMRFAIDCSNGTNPANYVDHTVLGDYWSVSAAVLFQWRWFEMQAGASFEPVNWTTVCFFSDISVGLFGSLMTAGVSAYYLTLGYNFGNTYRIGINSTNAASSINVRMPRVQCGGFGVGANLKFNITRDYYVYAKVMTPLLAYSISADFQASGLNPYTGRVPGQGLNNSSPLIELGFNFRFAGHHHLLFIYSMQNITYSTWAQSGSQPAYYLGSSGGADFYLNSLTIGRYDLGLGYQYEQ